MNDAIIYIVEGADGTGKSTFVDWLVQTDALRGRGSARVFHNDANDAKLPGSLYRHYRAQILEAIEFRDQGISTYIDRSFLSEVVYGGLYRGKSRISPRQLKKLEQLAVDNGVVLLGIDAPQDVRAEVLAERGEEWDDDQFMVGELYTQYFQHSPRWISKSRQLVGNRNN